MLMTVPMGKISLGAENWAWKGVERGVLGGEERLTNLPFTSTNQGVLWPEMAEDLRPIWVIHTEKTQKYACF